MSKPPFDCAPIPDIGRSPAACRWQVVLSLQEIDANGNNSQRDQIPWVRGLNFTATELALNDRLSIKLAYQEGPDTKDRWWMKSNSSPRS
jgi:hypothetical protein